MQITIFVKPESLAIFLEVTKVINEIPIEFPYTFDTSGLIYSTQMYSNWLWITLDMGEFLKFEYFYRLSKDK